MAPDSTGASERGGRTRQQPPQEQYELADYVHIQAHRDHEEKEARRATKRADKRRWLEDQDEMKFSHSIQFNAVPDWSSHYLAYSNLKKLCASLPPSYQDCLVLHLLTRFPL